MSAQKREKRIEQLQKLIVYHRERYHTDDAPEISDEVYDSLVAELQRLEGSSDETIDSEATVVGGDVSEAFSKVTHPVRQWSFSNVFSAEELQEWETRLYRFLDTTPAQSKLSYVAEHKIDGLKVILTYEAGKLIRAATRGNGVVGEDVTHTVRTIADVPHKLSQKVDIVCVGEVWLSFKEFNRINSERKKADEAQFANPRNAAAGTLRQLDASVAAERRLSMFVYDIDQFDSSGTTLELPDTQEDELQLLAKLGFVVNKNRKVCNSVADIVAFYTTWTAKRETLSYGIDGVVIKVNDVVQQRALGYTAKSPRYGTAFKFPAAQATTVVEDIQLQVGRTGVITPVAHLTPVFIDGSTVSRATLHNEDEINRLDVRVGDTIVLEKAGDIIPKVLSVLRELRPAKTKPYRFPKFVEGCGGDGSIERIPGEAAYRCVTLDSDHLHRQRLYYFVAKGALNIDGVGPRIVDLLVDQGLVKTYEDFFTLEVGDLRDLPSFKEKAAQNVVTAIKTAATVPLHRLLIGLSIDQVGEETARLIAEHFGTLDAIRNATAAQIAAVHGVGAIVGNSLFSWLTDPHNKQVLDRLLPHLTIENPSAVATGAFIDKTMVFTGTLPTLGRDEAKDLARKHGAKISNSVSKKTDYVVLGSDAGSKAQKAVDLGVATLTEAEFLKLIS